MKNSKREQLIGSIFTVICVCVSVFIISESLLAQTKKPDTLQSQDERITKIDSLMTPWFDADGPGGVVLVVQNGNPIFCKAYGLADLEHVIPITPTTVFNIASLDKQFIAYALALLVIDGSVSLDDNIHTYLPELPDYGKPITIRQMVNHTSGLPDEFSLLQMAGFWTDDVITQDQVFNLLQAQTHLLFQPGEKWQYSNSNYSLISKIIERVSGKKLSEFCYQQMFEPLHMTNTRFINDHKTLIKDRAFSYEYSDSGYKYYPVNYCPSLYTTAEDLIKWIINLENANLGGSKILELISERDTLKNGEPIEYSFGQFTKKYKGFLTFQHSGSVGAYTCFLVRFPEQHLAVACLSNAGYFSATAVGSSIADLFLPQHDEKETESRISEQDILPYLSKEAPNTSSVISPGDEALCAGLYQLETTKKILRVRYNPPEFALIHLSDVPLPLIPDVSGKFKMEGVSSKVQFIKNDSGNVNGLNLLMGKQIIAATKIKSVSLPQIHLRQLTGDYFARELMTTCSIKLTDSGLIVHHPRHAINYLTATDSLSFVGETKWLRQLNFEKDSFGKITGFYGSSGYAQNIWFQIID